MCLAQGLQHSDASGAKIRGPSVSSQALNHLATALPFRVSNSLDLDQDSHSDGPELG